MPLRPYQRDSANGTIEALRDNQTVVLQLPTGAGKTRTATAIIKRARHTVWFMCHRRELVRQADKALTSAGIAHAVCAPGYKRDYTARIQVCSIGTMRRLAGKYAPPSVIIWDEAHHIAARTWADLMERYPKARQIGLTATPQRTDGQGLAHWFDEIISGPTIAELIEMGHLATYRIFAPSKPDLDGIPVKRGDYEPAPLDAVMRDPRIVGDALEHYQRLIPGKRALLFATSIDASQALVDRFNDAGIPAKHVDGSTKVKDRDKAIDDLAAGRILVLSNYGVFTEGFDLPAIDAVILMRPTKSLALYLQMIGRAMRPAPGKECAYILDHAGLVYEHGFPDAEIAWTLEGGARKAHRTRVKRPPQVFTCPECSRVHKPAPACPECGYRYPDRQIKEAIAGQLEELNAEEQEREAIEQEDREAEAAIASAMDTAVPVSSFARIVDRPVRDVRRMIERGLPIDENGEVNVAAGLAWVESGGARGSKNAQ